MATKLIMAKDPQEAMNAKSASAAFLAGGTEVNRLGSPVDAETLISLKKCSGLSGIRCEDGKVYIGSMCTFQDLVECESIPAWLREAAGFMASRTKRNMATVGGNIAALRSDSYLLPALLAGGAKIRALGADLNEICLPIDEYIDEFKAGKQMLITEVAVPADVKVVSRRYSNTAQSHAVLTASASMKDGSFKMAAALKNTGLYLLDGYEEAVQTFSDIPYTDDMFGSPEYKRYLTGITVEDMYRELAGK